MAFNTARNTSEYPMASGGCDKGARAYGGSAAVHLLDMVKAEPAVA